MYQVDEDSFLPWKIRLIKIVIGFIAVAVMGFFVISNLRQTLSPASRYQMLFKRSTAEKFSKVVIEQLEQEPIEITDKAEIQSLIDAFKKVRLREKEVELATTMDITFHFQSGDEPLLFRANEDNLEIDLGPEAAAAIRPYVQ